MYFRYGSGTLTRTFLARVFQQCLTYDGEMDYKTYLDLVLALEYRKEPQSLQYLFRVLDIHGKGYLDGFTLNYFFKVRQLLLTYPGTGLQDLPMSSDLARRSAEFGMPLFYWVL